MATSLFQAFSLKLVFYLYCTSVGVGYDYVLLKSTIFVAHSCKLISRYFDYTNMIWAWFDKIVEEANLSIVYICTRSIQAFGIEVELFQHTLY